MKKVALILITSLLLISCKESTTYEGEFIFLEDAAVLKGDSFIYGVQLDNKMQELATIVKPLQRDKFDMVPVVIKATIAAKKKGTEGWDSIITIKKIIEVKAPTSEDPIKLEVGDKLKTEGTTIKVESGK